MHVQVWNQDVQRHFTWEDLGDVVEGLWLGTVARRRYWECYFQFRVEGGAPMGLGRVVRDADEPLGTQ